MKDSLPFRIPSVSLLIHLVMHSDHLFRLALAINPANCHTWTRCDYERLIPEKSYSANVWPVPSRLVRRLNIKYWREPHPSSSWIISLLLLLYSMGKDDVYWPNKTVSLSPKATQVCHLAQWLCLPRTVAALPPHVLLLKYSCGLKGGWIMRRRKGRVKCATGG